VRLLQRSLLLIAATLLTLPLARAQASFDLNMGFGTAHDGSNGGGIDSSTFLSCTPSSLAPTCEATPSLSGFFLGFGGDLMLYKHIGVGAEISVSPAKSNYGPLQFRQSFYDFNAIYAPVNEKRVQLQIQGGIGGAKTGFSYYQSQCVGSAVCTSSSEPVGNANHFQVHVGVGVQLFVTEHLFIRPEFDLHYVPSFTDQFNSNAAPAGMVWIGYSFGDRS